MRRFLLTLFLVGLAVLGAGWWLTCAEAVNADRFATIEGDATRGEVVFNAGGCASCHTAPESDDARAVAGGRAFPSPFGTFIAPNISTDPANGIGAWSLTDFASAILNGTSPEGAHYYPAFPYTTYTRMTDSDVADLWAYLQTLPAQTRQNTAHEVGFPFNIRTSLGPWKALYLTDGWALQAANTPELERGRYLVEALGHCGECHTPRNLLGAPIRDRWMAGAPNPTGKGKIPGITPAQFDWSAKDIAYYLETGFTPDFDSAGGEMVEVIKNTARLTPEDRAAIAAYVKELRPAN
jgi:mono/diheme cytochrome c family protein